MAECQMVRRDQSVQNGMQHEDSQTKPSAMMSWQVHPRKDQEASASDWAPAGGRKAAAETPTRTAGAIKMGLRYRRY